MPVLKGVGSAFLLKNDFFKNFNHVIRTSDRGGAQCGIHLVPYNKKRGEVYLGAGNYISNEEEPKARAETLRYLINTIENELVPKNVIYKSTCETFFGYRPRSLDKYPSIGPVNDNIFYISGTYRSGLTWAAFIANQVLKWLENNKVDDLLKIYKPDRELNTYGTLNKACNHYAKSRVSNLIEHEILNSKNKKKCNHLFKKLYNFSKNQNTEIVKKYNLKKNFIVDPDCYIFWKKNEEI